LAGYLEKQGLNFPVLADESGELAGQWGVVGVPATFIVDGRGDIAWAGMGYSTGPGLRLRLMLAED
jgi:peroxiredoxin